MEVVRLVRPRGVDFRGDAPDFLGSSFALRPPRAGLADVAGVTPEDAEVSLVFISGERSSTWGSVLRSNFAPEPVPELPSADSEGLSLSPPGVDPPLP